MHITNQDRLTEQEISTVAAILAKLEPGFLPFDIFDQIARLTVSSIVELVPLRINDGKVEVLLTKRDADDIHWPSMLHTAGTVVRATDQEGDMKSAFDRVINDELGSVKINGEPQYVMSTFRRSARGMENSRIFFIDVIGQPTIGEFYPVDNLPATVVDTQLEFIQAAAELFRNK